ncbi:hypothetical protein PHYBLDRAFT_162441 [Phycomyces blakesleeanus NRRL 1555(-)]|uniref:Uncharacterized protein n=1 Tax=Phycomyces blakesleeanus (strain ATCC 8743b / DSM 1359 / FGSC 10004 / NBRC 33097 / NRRL 1555) TaxID=763407 RepID=A0A167QAF1_PHYB8|nr:hypothetical protein PHYBLDRAFT_162441 [Phycomyces blakesleeanus NRRL 1555(-)]OAD79367.1 hypothetical protein PHYBLDRAFT_162441 [Phycomyces blakesleeanus NRRL 1555(-)]|eukprot:XP_018297407.1 hypothetical protein PHYBLDRAFT_162441 [Phycomyces blakesleeanus NRRL 1555(-)]
MCISHSHALKNYGIDFTRCHKNWASITKGIADGDSTVIRKNHQLNSKLNLQLNLQLNPHIFPIVTKELESINSHYTAVNAQEDITVHKEVLRLTIFRFYGFIKIMSDKRKTNSDRERHDSNIIK